MTRSIMYACLHKCADMQQTCSHRNMSGGIDCRTKPRLCQKLLLSTIWQHAVTRAACTQHVMHSPRTAYVNPTPRAEPALANPICQKSAVLAGTAL